MFKKGLRIVIFFPFVGREKVCCSFERASFIRSSSSQKKSEIKKKNHVRRCSLLRESRRPDDANELRADETRERETGESVEKPNRREGTFFRFSTNDDDDDARVCFLGGLFLLFFLSSSFVLALGKRLIFPSSSSKRGERKNAEEEEEREKKTKKIASRALSRARGRRTLSRASVATRVVFPFSGREIGRINFVHRRDLSSSCLVSSLKSLPGRTKEEEKRALVYYAKENESTDEDSRNPLFFFWNQNKQQTVIATTALVAASIVSPEASHAAQNVVAQVAEGEPFLVDVAWGAILSSFSFSLALVVWGRSGL